MITFVGTTSAQTMQQRAAKLSSHSERAVQGDINYLDNMAHYRAGTLCVNGCAALAGFSKEYHSLIRGHLKLSNNPPSVFVYTLFNGKSLAPAIEVQYSDRFMNNEVGPVVGFGIGGAVPLKGVPLTQALLGLQPVLDFLTEMEYKGELLLVADAEFRLTDFFPYHNVGLLPLYMELCTKPITALANFAVGRGEIELLDDIALAVTTTSPTSASIPAPENAEKHLWRVASSMGEVVIVTSRGKDFKEVRRRTYRTLDNLVKITPFLQYRTDFHRFMQFSLGEAALGENPTMSQAMNAASHTDS